jgi:L-threonylcarbamoyladenylate synthase
MKYKHYSPRAKVVLAERGAVVMPKNEAELISDFNATDAVQNYDPTEKGGNSVSSDLHILGIVRTRKWAQWGGLSSWARIVPVESPLHVSTSNGTSQTSLDVESFQGLRIHEGHIYSDSGYDHPIAKIIDVDLGKDTKAIAHGLFAALRELDMRGVDLIYVEGIEDGADGPRSVGGVSDGEKEEEGDIAAAVMNRLRKAASVIRS